MRIEYNIMASDAVGQRTSGTASRRLALKGYGSDVKNNRKNSVFTDTGRMQDFEFDKADGHISDAQRIFESAASGVQSPADVIPRVPDVPYGHLAKDGVISYNGVTFVCDEDTNSICLGDMSDDKEVLNILLSDGGHLKVNRKNLGDLAQAADMFSPRDLNLIMRAIAQDTKVQSMQQELDEMKNSIGRPSETSRDVKSD